MSVINAVPLLAAAGGDYTISRSVRLRSSASAYFNRTPASAGNRKTWTWSGWVKRGGLPSSGYYSFLGADSGAGSSFYIAFDNSTQQLEFGQGATVYRKTTQVFRDPSAWYHLVIHSDTTQATASNRLKIYVNGVQVTTFATSNDPSLNGDWALNNNVAHSIGADIPNTGARNYFDGYLTEVNFIDGQALTPSSFGETDSVTGVWKPKRYTGTYGTNGFYLNFSDNSNNTAATIGKDYSGNGNNWTPNNISVTAGVTYDSMLDVPTMWADGGNGRGNYAVLNPLKNTASISNANLQTVNAASAGYYTSYATMSMDAGKYYWEITVVDDGVNSRYLGIGVADPSIALTGSTTSAFTGTQAGNARGWAQTVRSAVSVAGTGLYNNGSTVNSTTRTTTSGTRVFMVAYDADTGKCWMGYEGTWWSGDPAAGTSQYFTATAPMVPVFNPYNDGSISTFVTSINFGQRPFSQTVPTGFKALNTQNLPDSTIPAGNKYMDVVLQTGNTTGRTVSGLAFQPDLVWVKNRAGSTNRRWGVIDSVRGVNKTLSTALTDAEVTSQTDLLTAFNSDGFTIGADAGLYGWNGFAESYVHFVWKESATSGFDIVTFTGTGANQSINHNLGVAPKMMITKRRDAGPSSWVIAFDYAGFTWSSDYFQFDTGAKRTDGANTVWRQAPTSSVFYVGSNFVNTGTYVAYLFSEVASFSRMGSYQGNGSSDGPFVFCGFRPRWVMIKRTDTTSDWTIWDTARDTYNVSVNRLFPNLSSAESTGVNFDITSNGFKLRDTGAAVNASGGTYIFAAFSETAFKFSLAR